MANSSFTLKPELKDIFTKELSKLMHGVIVGVVVDTSNPDGNYYGLRITTRNISAKPRNIEYVLWFVADEEGNGPGCFEIDKIK